MNLLASGVWQTIGSVALAILVLLAMITVHEFGHYVVGKILKFKITEFSIGFGPAIFKRVSKKTGEIFAIRLIPLGGYCAFDGEDGDESTAEKPETDAPFQDFQE
jgi:regulator of sigma E protease